jgi:tetratricopeptide (TPR) repeat protein
MKKKLVYLFLTLALVVSCGDEFAETPAVGAIPPEAFQQADGINLLLNAAYSVLDGVRANSPGNQFGVGVDNWWMDFIADDAHKGSTDGDQVEAFQLETNDRQTANGYIRAKFAALYAGVNRANAVLSAIAASEDPASLTSQAAEARFLRGHFYFELIKVWGNISVISVENFDNKEFSQPNVEGSAVTSPTDSPAWAQVEADFQYAIDNLPSVRADQSDPGRPTAFVARAYLGKTHLYQGEWSDALTQLQQVINSGEFALSPEYLDNFTVGGENGPESVFAVQFGVDAALSPNGNVGGKLNYPGGGPFSSCCGFYQPTIDLANAFQVDGDGLPLLDTYNQSDFANDYGINSSEAFTPDTTSPVDPRLDYTVGRRGIDYNGFGEHIGKDWIRANFADISGPYLPKKNVYQASEIGSAQGTGAWGQQHSGMNYNIIRYADVLLMAAEAAVETDDLGTALTYVNLVRDRAANMTVVQAVDGSGPAANYQVGLYTSFGDQDFARNAVRFERRIELGMEGQRLFDLTRWGTAQAVLTDYYANETRTITNFGPKVAPYQAHFDLLPIPVTSIDLSGGVLIQNPSY